MSAEPEVVKDGHTIMEELYQLTTQMVEHIHDSDFLLKGVEERQTLMDACDEWGRQNPEDRQALERDPKIHQLVDQILAKDKTITQALEELKKEVKKEVSASNAQQKVMGYLGNAISSSGSYMDVKLK
ncbi:MAG: hypothetical protein FWE32_03135 [Oscillospiraceae bacterium]|nr:hypothetical protein [Oscillospiraceae bacterium]